MSAMDFDRIKNNFRFRSGRPVNQSKRFPTRPAEKTEYTEPTTQIQQKSNNRQIKAKPASSEQNGTQTRTGASQNQDKSKEEAAVPAKQTSESESGEPDYELRPPASKPKESSVEDLSELLFSENYLKTLTSHPQLLTRFTTFLARYKPSIAHLVLQYVESQKVIKAISYANAVATTLKQDDAQSKEEAASLSPAFQESSQKAFQTLLEEGLPAWVTYSLVKSSTSCLTSEMTNQSTPLTQDLVGGLSEVFCITDMKQKDNPIVYASEEFYRLTGYGKENVIGYNCRFLQGTKTKKESVQRLSDAIKKGEEISETLLNYRRDGSAFMNVLMLAPLHDGKRNVKYFLGAQVDASRLVQGGRGVHGFERFLLKTEMNGGEDRGRSQGRNKQNSAKDLKQNALAKLRDLSMAFDLEESAIVQANSRSNSMDRDGSVRSTSRGRGGRRRLQEDESENGSDNNDESSDPAWKLSSRTPSGKLPGIYKKYVLIRPYPSLRIIFVSPAAKSLGKLQQRPFLSYVAAPPATLEGLRESFESNISVTAKISIMGQAGKEREGLRTGRWGRRGEDPSEKGKVCWISATPLRDGEGTVGVWMVVIMDKASVASNTGRRVEEMSMKEDTTDATQAKDSTAGDVPIKPKPVGETTEASNYDLSNGINGEEKNSTQRSDNRAQPEDAQADGLQTESLNGSKGREVLNEVDADDMGPSTPPSEQQQSRDDERTPRQSRFGVNSDSPHSARDVGLRAMDYLTSRSPLQGKHVNGDGEDGEGRTDWNAASPYSVD